jgi:tetratricopeptide (TPR) repeat protein
MAMAVAVSTAAGAAEVGELFDGAARLYEQGKYREAAAAYEQLAARSNATVSVWFNLGNAWFKAGEKGRAIACYRRAEKLAPRDPEISENLSWARTKVGTAGTPQVGFVDRFLRLLTPNEWAVVAIVGVWGWFVLMVAREWAPKFLTLSTAGCWMVAGGAGLLLVIAYTAKIRDARLNAVVITSEATVRFGPLEEAQSAFTLPDGSELLVTDRKGAWMEVRDSMGRRGWVAARNLTTLP